MSDYETIHAILDPRLYQQDARRLRRARRIGARYLRNIRVKGIHNSSRARDWRALNRLVEPEELVSILIIRQAG